MLGQLLSYIFTLGLTNTLNTPNLFILALWLTLHPSYLETLKCYCNFPWIHSRSIYTHAVGSIPARHKCWLLPLSSAVVLWWQINPLLPSPFNYSIIGIPEVLQFTVRLLEGETLKTNTHVPTCSPSHSVSDTHILSMHTHTGSMG